MSFFGKNIKKLRGINNLSQQEFGKLFDLSRASIGSYEEERADPKIEALINISKYFNLNIDDLLTKELYNLEKMETEQINLNIPANASHVKEYLEDRVENLEARLKKIENFLNQSK